MKEFEQALKRARALMSDTPEESKGAEDMSANRPVTEETPTIDGAPRTLPLSAVVPPPEEFDTSLASGLPRLRADFTRFRENFGAAKGAPQSVDGAFRLLRTQVLSTMQERGAQVLGITSPAAGAGKTVTAIHLAMACARRTDQEVVLADFDFRRPAIAQYLGASGFQSSIQYFKGKGRLTDYLTTNEEGNLRFFLTDRSSEMSAEYLAGPRMDDALDEFVRSSRNTIVIADLPPLIGCDDTIAMLPKLEALLLVLASEESRHHDFERVISLLPKEKLIGTVLNKVKGTSAHYDYY